MEWHFILDLFYFSFSPLTLLQIFFYLQKITFIYLELFQIVYTQLFNHFPLPFLIARKDSINSSLVLIWNLVMKCAFENKEQAHTLNFNFYWRAACLGSFFNSLNNNELLKSQLSLEIIWEAFNGFIFLFEIVSYVVSSDVSF